LTELDAADSQLPRPSVFLSYASEDREAARLLRDALPGLGLEVWYDESDLGGGEAWDQKIRRQIRECDYFMPLVSAQTEARLEGYFRREWRMAVERTLDMVDDRLFLLPVVIDDTDQARARVPEKFLTVQWLKVPGGQPTPALESLCRRVASGKPESVVPVRAAGRRLTRPPSEAAVRGVAEFPREEPGQRIRFWVEVIGWVFRLAWAKFQRLPRWIRSVAYVWICIALVSQCHSSKHEDSSDLSPANAKKLKEISDQYQGSLHKGDIAKLGAQIAKTFTDDDDDGPTQGSPLLAVPFTAPAGDAGAGKLADSAFAMTYGTISLSHRGQVNLGGEPLASADLGAAIERGRASHADYVLSGAVSGVDDARVLTVQIASVADGAVIWSKSYPAAGADPEKIAADVGTHIPALAPK